MKEVSSFYAESVTDAGMDAILGYQEEGVICLRKVLDQAWLDMVEQGIEQYFLKNKTANDSANVSINYQGDSGNFHYATLLWKQFDAFRKLVFESHLPDLFGSILQTEWLNLYYDFLLIKEPGCRKAITPWHQDHSYYCMNGRKIINCWIALDHIPKETGLRFIQRSHLDYPVHRAVHFAPNGEYAGVLKQRPLPPDFDQQQDIDVLSCDLNPGDALVWNSRTFHSAPGNTLEQRRAAISLNFCGDDVSYFDMPQEPDPPIRGEHLVDGGNITCDSFPLLRQK